jgi:Gp49-like protein DUF891
VPLGGLLLVFRRGRGVWELKISDPEGPFRVVYVVRRNDRIYVLHAFQKKTQQTPHRDIELARARFKESATRKPTSIGCLGSRLSASAWWAPLVPRATPD